MTSAPWVLGLLATLFAFASSGILPGPFGYQKGYSYSQTQRSSSDSRNNKNNYFSSSSSYNSVSLSPPRCSVLRRKTYYDIVRVPLFCQRSTGRTMPMPRNIDEVPTLVLVRMKTEGWRICKVRVTVPVYRYQRIPACCPGTRPYRNGACINTESRRVVEGTQGPCAHGGRLVVINGNQLCQCRPGFFGYRCLQALPRMPVPRPIPTPGQLLVSTFTNRGQKAPFPAFQVFQRRPPFPTVKVPRPLQTILQRMPKNGVRPGSLVHRIVNKGRTPPNPFVNKPPQVPNFVRKQSPKVIPLPPHLIKQNIPRIPVRPPPPQSPMRMPWSNNQQTPRFPPVNVGGVPPRTPAMPSGPNQNDVARDLAAVMYQRLLQEGLERQLTLRKQMEELMKQKFQQQQQLANELFGQRQQHQQPTNGPTNPTTEPRPIPPPSITEHPTTPMPPQDTFSVEHGTLPPVDMGEPSEEVGSDGMSWSDGIVGDHQTSNGQQQPQNTFGNGPASFPGFSQPGTLNLQEVEASKQKTESLVNQCMSQSGITTPLPQILESQDIEVFKQVCSKSPVVGPCIMTQAETTFGQDRAGLIGRQMLQSVLMFLGQLCSRLESMEAAAAAGHGGMTSEPVFPNSPPPMGVSEITTVVPEAPLPVKVNEEIVKKSEQPKLAPTSTSDAKQTNPQDPATKANAQVREKEVKVVEAAFPMWMILAMVGGCAALLLIGCLATCLCLRCRRKKKTVELDREPEKLPVPSTQNNFYAASPFVPPPQYPTTAVKQTLGGEEEEEVEEGAKVKAEAKTDEEGDAGSRSS